jgi:hydroxymethylbilane synthase
MHIPMATLRLVTRGSRLALYQSVLVKDTLLSKARETIVELIEVATTGDRQVGWSLEKQGGTGLFTKELEQRLLDNQADVAVHSSKDLPAKIVDGLEVAGYLPREEAHDVLVLRADVDIPSTIATGSPRRREQLSALYPKVEWMEIRGNVETRLNKIRDGYAEGTLLAAAGLNRLGIHQWENLKFVPLPITEMVPSPGQGAIAVQCRAGESGIFPAGMFCEATRRAVEAEKSLMAHLGGGCHSCIGAHVTGSRMLVFHEDTRYYEFKVNTADEDELAVIAKELLGKASGNQG